MKKKILSILLALSLCLPPLALAETTTPTTTTTTTVTTEAELRTALGLNGTGDIVKLGGDIEFPSGSGGALGIDRPVTLDLNGHVLKRTDFGCAILVRANLTLTDSDLTAVHYFTEGDDGLWALTDERTANVVTGGVITGVNDANGGGGVWIMGSYTFTMNGGNIVGCASTQFSGGGVWTNSGSAKFIMNGGSIVGCIANDARENYGGGGVCIDDGSFTMNGGTIKDCKATQGYGGGVCISGGSFIMNGGTIIGCTAAKDGNGIYLKSGALNNVVPAGYVLSGTSIDLSKNSCDDATVVPCTHADGNGKSTMGENNTCTACGVTCAHSADKVDSATGKCECNYAFPVQLSLNGATTWHSTVSAALNSVSANANATIKLFGNASGDATVSTGTVTLDLNGKTLTGGLTVSGGNATVNANGGKITGAVNLTDGDLTINGGDSGSFIDTVTASGGTLSITGGTFRSVEVKDSANANLTGGTFTTITNNKASGKATDLLGAGYAFATSSDGSRVEDLNAASLTEVKVISHSSHIDSDEDGSCNLCGKALYAKVTSGGNTVYYDSFSSALENAADNSTVTLLSGVGLTQPTTITGKKFTLDLNGKELSATSDGIALTIASGTELTLTGAENSKLTAPVVVNDGKLTVASENIALSNVSVTGGNLVVTANATFTALSCTGGTSTLSAGKYKELTGGSNKSLKDSGVQLGEGKAFRYYSNETYGAWVNTVELEDTNPNCLFNVTVLTVPIKSVSVTASPATVGYGYTDQTAPKLTAEATDVAEGETVAYQWYKYTDEGEYQPISNVSGKVYAIPTGLSIGDHKFLCTATVNRYQVMSDTVTVTVNKATMTASDYTAPTANTLTYNSKEQQLLSQAGTCPQGTTMQYSLDQKTWETDVSNLTGKDAKMYTVYWYIVGGDNYNDVGSQENPAGSVEVTIAPQQVTPTVDLVNGSFVFNGDKKKPTVTVTADNKTLTENTDYTVSYEDNINAGTNTAKAIVTAKTGGNYTFEPVTKTFTIGKADAMKLLGSVTGSCKEGGTRSQTASVANVGMPADAGTLSYSVGTPGVEGTATVSDFTVDQNGLVSYTIIDGVVGAVITLPVKINSTNYAESIVNVVVTLTKKDVPIVSANDINVTYTGSEIPVSAITGTAIFGDQTVAGSWSFTNAAPKNVSDSSDSVSVTFTPTDAANYSAVATIIKVTINKATPTGAPTYTAITTSGKKLTDAALAIGTITPAGGIIAWELDNDTEVTANTAYNWTYTPAEADQVNYTTLTGSITPYPVSSGGGGGGGSKPTTPSTPSAPSTSVTVPVTSDTASVEVKAEVSKDGTAKVEVSDKQIEEVASNGSGTVTVDVSGVKNVESVQVPSHVVETTNKAEETGLTVTMPTGSVALDETALDSVSKGEDVTVSVKRVPATDLNEAQQAAVGDMANIGIVVDVDVFVGSEKQSSFNGGKLTISVPYTPKKNEDPSKMTVWYIKDDGTIQPMGGSYDAEKKCFVFETTHLSRYVIVSAEDMPTFTDVPEDAYYADAVTWAVLNGITTGMTETTFGPDVSCTRAQIVTFLWRAAGQPEVTGSNPFSDVNESDYFYQAVLWAVENKITTGTTETTFAPEDTCTRAQAAAFIYRNEQANGGGFTDNWAFQLPFTDVPEWCYEAVAWCYMNGVTQGTSATTFSPNLDCSRAQIVTFLYRSVV